MSYIEKYSFPAAHLITEEVKNDEKVIIKGQTIKEHCKNVAEMARHFAECFGGDDAAALCGLAHDIGKYSKGFQKRIWENGPKVDHSTAGAKELFAMHSYGFLCVAGHHSGLPDTYYLSERLGKQLLPYDMYKQDISLKKANDPSFLSGKDVSYPLFVKAFYIRMLFSCLVDADYLDTELFMSQGNVNRTSGASIEFLCSQLENYIRDNHWLEGKMGINQYRSQILQNCISCGRESNPGLFTLTVPTGGGKTGASLAFALNHARKNGMKRVIYVVPYCAIIDQTVDVYNRILGEENILAHYSEAEIEDSESGKAPKQAERKKLAAENWDMPVIVTTAVQFFESLFSNRPGKCRKLHNIADSVIVFDEAQTIPADFLKPCVFAITELTLHYHTTCVLCTATQPSLEAFIHEYKKDAPVREICQKTEELYGAFRRVSYKNLGKISEEDLVLRLSGHKKILCIVSTKLSARRLYEMLPEEGKYHLSTWMTPEHRKRTLCEIREKLNEGKICRVISTSLIEAGVDVDFPTVYREQAGLDSIIQAGGRCNREGKRERLASEVFIFQNKESKRLPALMRLPAEVAGEIIRNNDDIDSLDSIKQYFDSLYYNRGEGLDREGIVKMLSESPRDIKFNEAGKKFKLIDSCENKTIFIPCDSGSIALANEIRNLDGILTRDIYRRVGKYCVSINEREFDSLYPVLEIINEEFAILADRSCYSEKTGLLNRFEGGNAVFA